MKTTYKIVRSDKRNGYKVMALKDEELFNSHFPAIIHTDEYETVYCDFEGWFHCELGPALTSGKVFKTFKWVIKRKEFAFTY